MKKLPTTIEPRMLTEQQVITYINRHEPWKLPNFPKKHPVLKKWDRHDIDEWIDATGYRGVSETGSQRLLRETIASGEGASATPHRK